MTDVNQVPVSDGTNPVIEPAPVVTPPVPGEKTDSTLLLKSLQEERDKRRIAEEEKVRLERELLQARQSSPDTGLSDEGRLIMSKVEILESMIADRTRTETMARIQTEFPALQGKSQEFDEFLKDPQNAGMALSTAARAFIIEKNLVEVPKTPPRKGLEKPQGGGQTVPQTGMTLEEKENLRLTNYRKYSALVREGKI